MPKNAAQSGGNSNGNDVTSSGSEEGGLSSGGLAIIIIILVFGLFAIPAVYFLVKWANKVNPKESGSVVPMTERSGVEIEVKPMGE